MTSDRRLWAAAVATHWGLDLPLTVLAIERYGGYEGNPAAGAAMSALGTAPGLAALQLGAFAVAGGMWALVRRRGGPAASWAPVVPGVLALSGLAAGIANLGQLALHVGGVSI